MSHRKRIVGNAYIKFISFFSTANPIELSPAQTLKSQPRSTVCDALTPFASPATRCSMPGHSRSADLIVCKLERLYVVILKRDPLQFVVPKAAIGGQQRPALLANKRKPRVIRRAALEEFQVPMNLNSVASQHLEYGLTVA
jgi:hypothetical protein